MSTPRVAVVLNPISGIGRRRDSGTALAERVSERMAALGMDPCVALTEGIGHARALALDAVRGGARVVVAWGGDGTVNEVASSLVHSDVALAIVPAGSGNGLARMLGIPFEPAAALRIAESGTERVIDVGDFDGRLFVNIAGVGLDAAIAHRFAENGVGRRGFRRYAELTLKELWGFTPRACELRGEGWSERVRPLLMAFANGREYGNGATIAPSAVLDDGLLDVVVVGDRSLGAVLWQLPKLFSGRAPEVPGVTIRQSSELEIASEGDIPYHVDGEPCLGGPVLRVRVVRAALRVMAPPPMPQSTKR